MTKTQKILVGSIVIGLILITTLWNGLVGKNDDQNWQLRQTIGGSIKVQDSGGYYPMIFNTVWTYPRVQEAFFSSSDKEGGVIDDSISVTFNDGGQSKISCFVRWQNPTSIDERKKLHRAFSGNPANIEAAVRGALINVCKNTAPLMSASQHQSARKAEYAQLVENQLRTGIYEMKRIKKSYKDKVDESGNPITIEVTEIVLDKNGSIVIAQESPLKKYGLTIQQFSITGTEYDTQTRKQFAAKKDAFLKAELSKSQKEEEVQKRLQVIEKGLREKAEMESKMNVAKIQAVIAAEKEKEVAMQQKLQAEVEANKKLSLQKIGKEQAEVKAAQQLAIAEIEKAQAIVLLEKAKLDAQAQIELAKAKQKQIELSGAITELDRITLTLAKETKIGVAKAIGDGIGKATLPKTMIIGGGQSDGDGTGNLMKMFMLKMVEEKTTTK